MVKTGFELVWISRFGLLLPNFALHFVALQPAQVRLAGRSPSLGYASIPEQGPLPPLRNRRLIQHKVWWRSHEKRIPNKLFIIRCLSSYNTPDRQSFVRTTDSSVP